MFCSSNNLIQYVSYKRFTQPQVKLSYKVKIKKQRIYPIKSRISIARFGYDFILCSNYF